jgi:hypothetical protein
MTDAARHLIALEAAQARMTTGACPILSRSSGQCFGTARLTPFAVVPPHFGQEGGTAE